MYTNIPSRRGAAPAPEPERFSIIPGLLCEAEGVTLSIEGTPAELVVRQGKSKWAFPLTTKRMGKRTNYLTVTATKVWGCAPLAARLKGRLPETTSKGLELHRIVAVVGRGADFTLNGGHLAAHHVNLNGGDNRADNLQTVSTEVHDRLHRHIDQDVDRYLNALARDSRGMSGLPAELLSALEGDLATYEGCDLAALEEDKQEEAPPPFAGEGDDHPKDTEDEKIIMKDEYNPVTHANNDHSLNFDHGAMMMTATFPDEQPILDKKGKPECDDFGRPKSKLLWAPYIASYGKNLILPGAPLPDHLSTAKSFHLEGRIGKELRFSPQGIEAFVAGTAPPTDLALQVERAFARRLAFTKPEHAPLLAAAVAMSYVFPLADRCPFFLITSNSPGAGKSVLMETASRLVFNAHSMGVSSLAATIRYASLARGTLLLDEQEKLASHELAGDLIEVLNARSDAGTTYRNVGPDGNPRSFDLFGPTFIANLAGLTPTLLSRSIVIEMEPLPEEGTRHLERATKENWQGMRDALLLWAGAHWKAVKATHDTDPAVNVGGNRHADLWRLLLAVSKHFGGEPMFSALHALATASATTPRLGDVEEAMVVALAGALKDEQARAQRTGNKFGPFNISLKALTAKALEALEDDQHKRLDSKTMADFARRDKLKVARSSEYGGANAVFFNDPSKTITTLRRRYPHLRSLFPKTASSDS